MLGTYLSVLTLLIRRMNMIMSDHSGHFEFTVLDQLIGGN